MKSLKWKRKLLNQVKMLNYILKLIIIMKSLDNIERLLVSYTKMWIIHFLRLMRKIFKSLKFPQWWYNLKVLVPIKIKISKTISFKLSKILIKDKFKFWKTMSVKVNWFINLKKIIRLSLMMIWYSYRRKLL